MSHGFKEHRQVTGLPACSMPYLEYDDFDLEIPLLLALFIQVGSLDALAADATKLKEAVAFGSAAGACKSARRKSILPGALC